MFCLGVLNLCLSAESHAISNKTESTISFPKSALSIPNIKKKVEIDGKLDDEIWQSAVKLSLNYETMPNENVNPDVATQVYLAEDSKNLYIAFRAQDSDASKIRAFYRDRDEVSDDDYVAITLDTFNDSTRAYRFYTNALGVQKDSIINGNSENDSWDAIWYSASEITDLGYVVELAIPLKVLSFPATKEQVWGIGLLRSRPRSKLQEIQFAPKDRSNDCDLCQLRKFNGFEAVKPESKLLVVPSLTTNYQQGRAEKSSSNNLNDWHKTSSSTDLGLDVEWGVDVNSTLNITINPDFSQIEADSSQLTVNNQYALLFNEKRNFFLEGADYFDSPMRAIYTRSIADPDYGVKYTTKINEHTVGLIAGRDAVTNIVTPNKYHTSTYIKQLSSPNDASTMLENDFFVSRYRYDLGNSSNVGVVATYRSAQGYDNGVIGVDSKFRFNDQDSITMQILTSKTTVKAEQNSLTDQAYYLRYNHSERDWYGFASYISTGQDFRADLGFFNRFSNTKLVIGGGYIWYGESDDFFNRIQLSGDWDMTKDDDGRKLEQEAEIYLTLEGPMQSRLRVGGGQRDTLNSTTAKNANQQEYRLDSLYNESFYQASFDITPLKGLFLDLDFSGGDQVDYANNQLGDSLRFDFSMNYNINRYLELSLDYVNSALEVTGGELFNAKIANFKLNYQFDIKTGLRITLQNSQVDKDPTLYKSSIVQREKDTQALQLLFSYKFNPKTVAFVGYADSGFTDNEAIALSKTERNLFMKFSYAF